MMVITWWSRIFCRHILYYKKCEDKKIIINNLLILYLISQIIKQILLTLNFILSNNKVREIMEELENWYQGAFSLICKIEREWNQIKCYLYPIIKRRFFRP